MNKSTAKETVMVPVESKDSYIPPPDDDTLLQSVNEAAQKVSPYALYELATDPYPPKVVQEVVEAVCMLLGIQTDWHEVKKLIEQEKLSEMIQEFHPESVPDIYLEQISEIAQLHEMQLSNLEKHSLATAQLGEWIHSVAIYYDVKHKPMMYSFMCDEPEEPEPVIESQPILEPEPVKAKEPEKKEEPKKAPPPRIVSIKEALDSIKNLNKQDIVEVKSYKKPPGVVLHVLEALCILFDAMKMERKGKNQIVYEPNYKKLLQETDPFIRKVLTFDYDKIPKDKVKRLKEYIAKPEFELEKVKRASVAAASFSLLIVSIVQKFEQPTVQATP